MPLRNRRRVAKIEAINVTEFRTLLHSFSRALVVSSAGSVSIPKSFSIFFRDIVLTDDVDVTALPRRCAVCTIS